MQRRVTAIVVLLLPVLAAGCHGFFQDPILQSIALNPSTVIQGSKVQLVATGSFDDGSTDTLKSGLAWSSSTTSVATVDSSSGMLTGVSTGTSTITAQSGSVQGAIQFTVTSGPLMSITVSCSPQIVPVSQGQFTSTCVATGNYSGGQSSDLTQSVLWNTSNSGVTINSSGVATATTAAVGQFVILTATLNSVSGSANLTVQ
jgi:hypothetical protein